MRNVLTVAACFLSIYSSAIAQEPAAAKVEVGKPAPKFSVGGIDGKPIKLEDLTAKGKNVVLLFDRAHW
ncbi:MAG: hypothetical protein AAGG48_29140 [Planctomycetota bacterium]